MTNDLAGQESLFARDTWCGKTSPEHLAATKPDGTVFTGYYNADATDKAVFAHNIQSDVTMDIIRENIGKIKEMLEENDDG